MTTPAKTAQPCAIQQELDQTISCYNAAIEYALKGEDGMLFLKLWYQGDFEAIRREWDDVPESVFIGADPLHPDTLSAS